MNDMNYTKAWLKMKKKEWFRLCAWMMISNQKNDTKRMNDIGFQVLYDLYEEKNKWL